MGVTTIVLRPAGAGRYVWPEGSAAPAPADWELPGRRRFQGLPSLKSIPSKSSAPGRGPPGGLPSRQRLFGAGGRLLSRGRWVGRRFVYFLAPLARSILLDQVPGGANALGTRTFSALGSSSMEHSRHSADSPSNSNGRIPVEVTATFLPVAQVTAGRVT